MNPQKYNPYNFSNPVIDPDLFVGRTEERDEINYYLDQAKLSPHPTSLAILGARGSGKTSLLNMCEVAARERDLLPVRIDLDENDSKSDMQFFFKFFDSLFARACESGAYGGLNSPVYSTYLEITNRLQTASARPIFPFMFPVQYSIAVGSGNREAQVSEHHLKTDLNAIRAAVGRTVAILFDEGNVLATNRALLQKLRNVFMSVQGYMLVLTGTPDLFPVMDNVFSPIVRQFKKLFVGPFKESTETRDCVSKPLAKLGLRAEDIFDFEIFNKDVHELSGGRPYEIQLICHFMYKRVHNGAAGRMQLDYALIEEVRRELETSQDVSSRPILAHVRALSSELLRALGVLCACSGSAGLDTIWPLYFSLSEESRSETLEQLEVALGRLSDLGIVSVDESGVISFLGDDFDRIYTRYFSRERKVRIDFRDFSPEEYAVGLLIRLLAKNDVPPSALRIHIPAADFLSATQDYLRSLTSMELTAEMVERNADLSLWLYTGELVAGSRLIWFSISGPSSSVGALISPNILSQEVGAKLSTALLQVVSRAATVGLTSENDEFTVPTFSSEHLRLSIESSRNQRFLDRVCNFHRREMLDAYLQRNDLPNAIVHANSAVRSAETPSQEVLNNLGYLYIQMKRYDEAEANLVKSATSGGELSLLSRYNLALIDLLRGDLVSARNKVNLLKTKLGGGSRDLDVGCVCLLYPVRDGETYSVEERRGDVKNLLLSDAVTEIDLILSGE